MGSVGSSGSQEGKGRGALSRSKVSIYTYFFVGEHKICKRVDSGSA